MRLAGTYLVRAVRDANDAEAREHLMWAATLAGIAFGNAGVHAPHAMAYAIAGRVKSYAPAGYPTAPIVPHGIAVAVAAPSVFAQFGGHGPARHLEAAALLGADTRGADLRDSGAMLAARVVELSRAISVPDGIGGVGYAATDIDDLIAGTLPQQRLLANAPCEVDASCLRDLFTNALTYA